MQAPIPMPAFPRRLIEQLNDAGFEAWAVGGCVRDVLLGKTPLDWDITTNAVPEEIRRIFAAHRVIETGIQHGTVTVLIDGQAAEITTYRMDSGYADSRHPDTVTFTPSLSEDLKRRDFTVNALVWHPHSGIADYVGGIEDLQHRILRCVGDPDRRLTEDALRILRALRFAAVYSLTPETATDAAIRRHRDALRLISVERIRTELFRLLCGSDAAEILAAYSEVFAVPLPEVFSDPETPAFSLTLRMLAAASPVLPCRLAILLQHHPAETPAILRRLKTDNDTIRQVTALLDAKDLPLSTDPVTLKHALRRLGEPTLRLLLSVRAAEIAAPLSGAHTDAVYDALEQLLTEDPCYSLDRLQINGHDLQRLGFHGRAIGAALENLLNAVIEETVDNDPAALEKRALSMLH